jgi:hypothetical protein
VGYESWFKFFAYVYIGWKIFGILESINSNLEVIKNTSVFMKDEYLENYKYNRDDL